MIGPRLAKPVALAMLLLQLSSTFVYAGFLYLPFSKTYAPSVFVYDSYTLNKGWPTYYNPAFGGGHTGTDYRGDGYGTPVYAAAGGVVTALRETENDRCDITYAEQLRYGNYVLIEHQVGRTKYRTEYWHLKQNGVVVNVGDRVSVGTLIAYVSNSGLTCGLDCKKRSDLPYGANYHLHFEVKKWNGNRWVVANPYNKWTGWLWATNPPSPSTQVLIRPRGDHPVYLLENGVRRWIPNPPTLLALFPNSTIHDLDPAEVNAIPRGPNIPSIFSGHYLLRARGTAPIYFIEYGKRRWIPNPPTLHALFPNLPIQDLDPDVVNAIPRGTNIPSIRSVPCYLIRPRGDSPVYLLENRMRRWIPDRGTFNALGFDWGKIQIFDPFIVNVIPRGADILSIRSVPYYLIRSRGSHPVYLLESGVRRWVPDPDTLHALFPNLPVQDFDSGVVNLNPQGADIPSVHTVQTLKALVVAQGSDGWYSTDVSIIISGSSPYGIRRIAWQFEPREDGDWKYLQASGGSATLPPISEDGGHSIRYNVSNGYGYWGNERVITVKIDKTPPSSSLQTTNLYQNSLPFSIPVSASDGESGISRIGLYKRRVGEKKWQHHWTSRSGSIPERFNIRTLDEGRWEFASCATDLAGNKEELPQEPDVSLVLDQTPPQTTLSVNGPSHQKEDKLFVSPQTEFELTADDINQTDPSIETSGVAQTNYQIDKDEEQIYEGEFPIENEDGKHEIKYQSDDVAGNEEPQKSQEVYLDSTPPTSTDYSDGGWHNEDVAVLIVSSDGEGSGVKAIYYSGAEEGIAEGDQVVVIFENEGVHELSYYAVDNVENIEGEKHAELIKIDETPPTIEGFPDREPSEYGWYNEDVVVHFEAEDQLDLSGLKSVTPDTIISTEGEDQEVTGTAEDNAGNTASTTVGGINIDKTDPASEITFPEEGVYYNAESWEEEVRGIASDNLSGVESVEVEVEGVEEGEAQLEDCGALETGWEYPLEFSTEDGSDDGEYTVRSCATDMAENQESTDKVTFIYDNTPPTSEIEEIEDRYINEEELDEGVELEFTAEDNIELKHVYLNERYKGGEWGRHNPGGVESVSGTEAEGEFTVKSLKLPGSGENREGLWEFSSSAKDKANNAELIEDVDTWIIYDISPPTSAITSVAEGEYYNAETWPGIFGTADDINTVDTSIKTSGVARVEIWVDKNGEVGEWVLTEGTADWFLSGFTPSDGSYIVYSRATDLAGNRESTFAVSFVYDNTPPVTSAELSGVEGLNGWHVSLVSLAFSVDDAHPYQTYYSIDSSNPQVYLESLDFEDGEYIVEFWSVDLAGNEEEHQIVSFKIDQTPPSSQLNELDLYYSNPFELTYTYLDNLSGVERARLYKRVPGEDWGYHGGSSRKPSKPFKVGTLSEGRWEFASVAVDYAGNIEVLPGEADTWTIYDITPPTSIITSIEEGTYYNYRTWPGIFGEADDNLSGVAQVEVRVDKDGGEGEWMAAGGSDSWSFDFNLEDGFYTVYSRAADGAGNQESTFKVSFVYDNTPPVTSVELSGTEGSSGWYVSPVTLSLSVDDANPSQTFYLIDDSDPQVYSELLNFEDGEHTIEFWSEDLAGNIEQEQEVTFKIDTVVPQAPMVSIPGGTFTEGETLRVSLAAEGGAKIYYSLDGSEPILYSNLIAITGDATLSVYAIDEAGNRSASVEFSYVFNPPPSASLGTGPQVLGVRALSTPKVDGETPGDLKEDDDLPAGEAGVKGEEAPTATGETSPKGSEVWLLLLVILIGGIPYFLLRWRIFLRK